MKTKQSYTLEITSNVNSQVDESGEHIPGHFGHCNADCDRYSGEGKESGESEENGDSEEGWN